LRGVADAAQFGNIPDVDQLGRLLDAIFHAVEEIDAAGFHHGAVVELRKGSVDGGAICEDEAVHARFPPCRSAARTTAGVMGVRRTRTPVAL
jgi:hypothetical protein